MEPYRIKTVEHLPESSREERARALKVSGYNPFMVSSRHVTFDLLTDSGTGGMSGLQWAAVLNGDESYAGARSFHHLDDAARTLTGHTFVLPIHQARAAERIVFHVTAPKDSIVLGNGFLDTGRIHLERQGARPVNIAVIPSKSGDFNGDINLKQLERYLSRESPKVAIVYLSVTCHRMGGQPVSMSCIRATSQLCRKHKIPFYLDAAHYATNCWFVKLRERDFAKDKPLSIAKEMFSLCDGAVISAKKDGHCNTGALLTTNIPTHHESFSQHLILSEGFVTYGGMTGRDMEAVSVGLLEALEDSYLRYRVESVAAFGEMLKKRSVPIVEPVGGYGVCIDAGILLSHLDAALHPAWALGCALFLEGGIRGSEDGNIMNCASAENNNIQETRQLLRLSVPPRTYTLSQLEHVTDIIASVVARRTAVSGMRLKHSFETLGHFNAVFEPVNKELFPSAGTDENKKSKVLNGYRRM